MCLQYLGQSTSAYILVYNDIEASFYMNSTVRTAIAIAIAVAIANPDTCQGEDCSIDWPTSVTLPLLQTCSCRKLR